jgi:glycosyltransferase involved in cell wall biosynthesis/tetratricopeptide (TPR) repeat protein
MKTLEQYMVLSAKISLNRIRKYINVFRHKFAYRYFDALFYHGHYSDLNHLTSVRSLKRHYINHGVKEGRLPNSIAYINQQKDLLSGDGSLFDIMAYRFHNRDLLKYFDTDDDLLEHYVIHGKKEGRVSVFSGEDAEWDQPSLISYENWHSLLSVSQLIAWCGDRLKDLPATRDEAISVFNERGINELWPINFEYLFDPDFYRIVYKMDEVKWLNESELYRHWLYIGYPAGQAPNEQVYLYPFLGNSSYPEYFNWKGYLSHINIRNVNNRSDALKYLFENAEDSILNYVPFFGSDSFKILSNMGKYLLNRDRFRLAAQSLNAALQISNATELVLLLADAYRLNNDLEKALSNYLVCIRLEGAPLRAYAYVIDIYCNFQQFDDAFNTLSQAFENTLIGAKYRDILEGCIDRYFQYQSACAHNMYKKSVTEKPNGQDRAAADSFMLKTLEKITDVYLKLDISSMNDADVKGQYVSVLANDSLKQCNHYRIEQKILQFKAANIPLKVFALHQIDQFIESLIGASCAIFYRTAATPVVIRAILVARQIGLPTYYEIDDLIFDSSHYPDSFESFEGQITIEEFAGLQFGVPLFRYAMSLCDYSIASTPPLANRMHEVVRYGVGLVIRNALDHRNETSIEIGASPRPDKNGKIRIFYGSGTKAHNADFNDILGPALIQILTRHDRVDLVIVGHLKLRSELKDFGRRIKTYPFVSNIETYWSVLAGCDINIAVLNPGAAADCKSEIKWLEAAILQIPSIVSDTATYRDVIQEGVDGFLATDQVGWQAKLEVLIGDTALRHKIGAQARTKALRDYAMTSSVSVLKSALVMVGSSDAVKVAKPKLRVLICNVFFSPQSIGGATRVVEDNVKQFSKNYDDLEIGVFCSENDGASGELQFRTFDGIPIYRLGITAHDKMDWHPFDPENATSFDRVIDHFQPDLVHFHCIQRLTASLVENTLRRGIPYVVTLHDGWWISDNQFFVNENGFLKMPTPDVLEDCAANRIPLPSIERRQRLSNLLKNANARLSVSLSFARIYENAGVDDIRVIENGVSDLAIIEKKVRGDGRLALGHIGGRASHKGAYLVESVLRQGNFENLHLTMIDATLPPGTTIETFWGTTPVTLSAPYRQTDIVELYSLLDVLLAPSTWPESFGLVTREALSLGLWVVASDQGAIGEGVIHDQNGYLIDTRTAGDIKRVLHAIDADHLRYQHSPQTEKKDLRPSSDQARELRSLYWEVSKQGLFDSSINSASDVT